MGIGVYDTGVSPQTPGGVRGEPLVPFIPDGVALWTFRNIIIRNNKEITQINTQYAYGLKPKV